MVVRSIKVSKKFIFTAAAETMGGAYHRFCRFFLLIAAKEEGVKSIEQFEITLPLYSLFSRRKEFMKKRYFFVSKAYFVKLN